MKSDISFNKYKEDSDQLSIYPVRVVEIIILICNMRHLWWLLEDEKKNVPSSVKIVDQLLAVTHCDFKRLPVL